MNVTAPSRHPPISFLAAESNAWVLTAMSRAAGYYGGFADGKTAIVSVVPALSELIDGVTRRLRSSYSALTALPATHVSETQ